MGRVLWVLEQEFVRHVQAEVAGVDGVLPSPSTISIATYTSKPEFIYSKPTIIDKRIQVGGGCVAE